MLVLRRIFFYLFIVIYLVFCPLIIFYALGYIYEPGNEPGLVKSGLIYLSTAPPNATVYLGNRRYRWRTPTVLPSLIPGDYPVKLVLKKHKPWSEVLPVEKGKATVLERILLEPEERKTEVLFANGFDNITPIQGSRFFLVTKTSRLADAFLFDWKDEKLRPIFHKNSSFGGMKISSYASVPESSALLIQTDSANGRKFFWASLKGKEVQIEDLTDLFLETPERIEWDPGYKKYLFAFQNGHLNRIDLISHSLAPQFLERLIGYGLFERKIYALRDNFTFEQLDFEGRKEKTLLQDPLLGKSLFGENEFYQIKIFSDDIIFFLGKNGELLANRLPYRFVSHGILGMEFYQKDKRLLVWASDAIGIIDFSKERAGEENVFETGPKVVWLFKQGEKIEQAFWVYEGSHILFRDKNKVFLLELETYGKPHLYELAKVKDKSSVFYSEEAGKLYYLDASTGNLSYLEVLPRRDLLLLPFPERKEEKKKVPIEEL
ncbi:MAG: PEGA domain-containing protein [Candidatus Omnitrophica bacterium]|nr:PEGA domain-containing protein [Candidatus Omnitrophota bacterium]